MTNDHADPNSRGMLNQRAATSLGEANQGYLNCYLGDIFKILANIVPYLNLIFYKTIKGIGPSFGTEIAYTQNPYPPYKGMQR